MQVAGQVAGFGSWNGNPIENSHSCQLPHAKPGIEPCEPLPKRGRSADPHHCRVTNSRPENIDPNDPSFVSFAKGGSWSRFAFDSNRDASYCCRKSLSLFRQISNSK
jgi:hypothetical protein